MDKIIVYCDGACSGNQFDINIGGWGAVLQYKDKVKEICGGERNTTNNIMELTAAIKSLESIKTTNIPVEMYIDSAYVVNGMNDWIAGWIKKGWRKSNKKPVENKELWIQLNELRKRQSSVVFIKVKGHNGVELNELADALANKGMDQLR
ncbi:ribonuclease HI [Bacillus sp. AG4(2022)]|uniref:ribonuclease HI n=1 Tax=Bacillus sp. AG4(2022) TaxID=2962594 RepID=UPI002881EA34|nr:ribonuclease HI [Bacillus sp. AG4(2022)]MDT0160400.1 ribonuclease HI [Bacillus sp. AG4(2022)]